MTEAASLILIYIAYHFSYFYKLILISLLILRKLIIILLGHRSKKLFIQMPLLPADNKTHFLYS